LEDFGRRFLQYYWEISTFGESLMKKETQFESLLSEGKMERYSEIKQSTSEIVGLRVMKRLNTRKAHAAIRDLIVQHETLSYSAIAKLVGVSRWLIYSVAVEFGVQRPRGAGSPARSKIKGELQ
jgi:hypothetical protein